MKPFWNVFSYTFKDKSLFKDVYFDNDFYTHRGRLSVLSIQEESRKLLMTRINLK